MFELHEPHDPIRDCDCRECAIAERDRLRSQAVATTAIKRLRDISFGVRIYGAPDSGLLADRIDRLCDEIETAGIVEDMTDAAKRAVSENMRHSEDSLFALIGRWFPESTDDEVWAAVRAAL